ncbi:BZ3500_MvSof-1268-A1-R1_Chr5-2g07894 [Microbotryum saponariae]|uniref:BZ3500_MvSof-1268-A1-R1_Chr5-2g07894 protein n=1 Tax=Microbotryum saponariae TaxID=289078 RepID=A0A2X0KMJ7_9BASI|nr:BZ3500_MvSof-1268-A1-R1_Chr5-2g07894 [Microbotryum saponariae]SDA05763.1 BZ3501_MvSof-1269-A2-R1_Chr5-2g07716 [Microbotryum saponariae]
MSHEQRSRSRSPSSNPFNQTLDALPYYDRDLESPQHQRQYCCRTVRSPRSQRTRSLKLLPPPLSSPPALRGEINSLIAIELRSILPPSSSASQQPTNLTHLPAPRSLPISISASSPLLASELARARSKKPLPSTIGLDTTRYAMPDPPTENADDLEAWERAYKSSLAQLEHQRLRSMNGHLLAQPFGANAWKVHNYALENTLQRVDAQLQSERDQVDDLNRKRKAEQDKAGEILTSLEKKWTELVSGNMQLEIGCMTLEAQVAELQARHAELSHRLQTSA